METLQHREDQERPKNIEPDFDEIEHLENFDQDSLSLSKAVRKI